MKIRIPSAVDRAARTLLVAGSLGVPATAVAQTAPSPPPEKKAPAYHGAGELRALSQTAKDLRAIEMKVEVAWLADPATSACRLEARTLGTTLEVHGQVPNEAALAQALHLARQESGMWVVSKLEINPRLKAPGAGKPQDVLHREAFNALRHAFPRQAPSITVSTLADGQVVLKGTVPSYEDKLAVGRHVRQASGCSCVINQLQVLGEMQDGGVQNNERTSGATLLSPEPLKPQGVQPVALGPRSEPASAATAPPAPHSPGDTTAAGGPPSAFKAAATRSEGSMPARLTAQAEPAGPRLLPQAQPATAAKPAAKPLVYRTQWRRLDPSEVATPNKAASVATSKEPANVRAPVAATAPPKPPRTFLRVIPSVNGDPDRSSGSSAPVQSVAAPVAQPSPTAVPVARPRAPAVAKREPYVTDGVVLIDTAVQPASHSAPVKGQEPPRAARTGPYVTSGVILFADSGNEGERKPNPALSALQTRLQQRIAAVCGKASKDVEVTAITETNVAVRVKASSTLEGEELSNRIFRLPELGPCQVSLDVVVMK